jgi:acyl dehydratase
MFAGLTGDGYAQHVDAEWAAASPYGARVAHGMLVLAYTVGFVSARADQEVAMRRVRHATFKRPVHLGDTLHGEGRVTNRKALGNGLTVITIAGKTLNQRREVVLSVEFDAVVGWGDREEQSASAPSANGSVNGLGGADDTADYRGTGIIPM